MIHTSYTVGITTGEYRALQYVTGDIDFWVSNVLKERARNAYEDIQQKYVTTKISKGEPITAIGLYNFLFPVLITLKRIKT